MTKVDYKKHKDIKGAPEYLKKLHDPLVEYDKDIAELEKEKERLTKELPDRDSHKLADIKKNKELNEELDLVEIALERAHKRKDDYTSTKITEEDTYNEIIPLLDAHVEKVKDKHKATNKKIIELIYEARSLYDEMKEDDVKERQKISAFINEMKDFTDRPMTQEEDAGLAAMYGTSNSLTEGLRHHVSKKKGNHGLIFDTLSESAYGIKGLLKYNSDIAYKNTHLTMEGQNKKYGVKVK